MAYSALQKVAMVSGLVLCASLLLPRAFLPRGRKRDTTPEGKPGRFPPVMRQHVPTAGRAPAGHFPRSHLAEAVAKAKGGGGGGGGGSGGGGGGGNAGGRGLVGQIIPIYGFGILLYILYILFKLSSKGKTATEERKYRTPLPGNTHRKITNYELAQLQQKLRETEEAMENLINRVGPHYDSRAQKATSDQERRLLQQLKEITRVMREGKLIDGISPEKEAEEMPFTEDWEGYPEETYPIYDLSDCLRRRQDTILVDFPDPSHPSAEEEAERTGVFREGTPSPRGVSPRGPDSLPVPCQAMEPCPCCLHQEDDPAVLAENTLLNSDSSEPEEATWEERDLGPGLGAGRPQSPGGQAGQQGSLRKRSPRGCEGIETLGHAPIGLI
ncbi:protein RIC-3 isoform X1 [Ornithorhynchus anatinus]|uniref:protein RIC-3 isoform X1 n=1 Tax=Ornithorhynchus anatinus TaxID=9258 RepID=UPI0010A86662|nr:protein RIC-3 isoform X1 [Ornithorhynchus anatinus]